MRKMFNRQNGINQRNVSLECQKAVLIAFRWIWQGVVTDVWLMNKQLSFLPCLFPPPTFFPLWKFWYKSCIIS